MEITKDVYRLSKQLPDGERYGLVSQTTRAAVSIPANIAEGGSRTTDKHYKQFLSTALGSSYELETLLLIIRDSQNVNNDDLDQLIEKVIVEQRMINAFINKLD